jgi:hypothetical protein
MNCNQHNLEQDFTGCYVCSECARIWMPVQPEEYDAFVKKTMSYDEPILNEKLQGGENELQM